MSISMTLVVDILVLPIGLHFPKRRNRLFVWTFLSSFHLIFRSSALQDRRLLSETRPWFKRPLAVYDDSLSITRENRCGAGSRPPKELTFP